MKEECEQRKEERRKLRKRRYNKATGSINLLRRFQDFLVVHHTTVSISWSKQRHYPIDTQIETTERNCYSTLVTVSPKQLMLYQKEPSTSKLRMQYYTMI